MEMILPFNRKCRPYLLLVFLLVCAYSEINAQTDPLLKNAKVLEIDTVHKEVEIDVKPAHPEGQGALLRFLAQNIEYPTAAKEGDCQGMVVIQCIISKTGQVIAPRILKSSGSKEENDYRNIPHCYELIDREALRVVKLLPKLKPGLKDGVAVNVLYNLPISYKLE